MKIVIPDVKCETGWTFRCFVKDSNFNTDRLARDTLIGMASAVVGGEALQFG